jgi:hypothetical protein
MNPDGLGRRRDLALESILHDSAEAVEGFQ